MVLDRKLFRIIFVLISANVIFAQSDDGKAAVRESVNSFSTNLLRTTTEVAIRETGDSLNIALSPYTVWTLMSIISEGARGDTLKQIETALALPKDRDLFRNVNKEFISLLKNSPGVTLDVSNAIFTTIDQKLNSSFQQIAKKYYNVDVTPTNFKNPQQAASAINNYVSSATKGRIQNFIVPGDIIDALIFLTSTMYFKGQWQTPFNKSATTAEPFYDEQENRIGTVQMMYQADSYPFTRIDNLVSFAVELPYGKGDRSSMIVLLPYKGETTLNVLKLMNKYPLSQVMKDLAKSAEEFSGEDVVVYLPKFKTNSDLNLNVPLSEMGIKDIFSLTKADLLGMFPHYLHVHRLIQKAEIEVNEEGTVASAAAGADFSYKSPPPKFHANKPFLYFIVDKPTGCVMFEGRVSNPNSFQ